MDTSPLSIHLNQTFWFKIPYPCDGFLKAMTLSPINMQTQTSATPLASHPFSMSQAIKQPVLQYI